MNEYTYGTSNAVATRFPAGKPANNQYQQRIAPMLQTVQEASQQLRIGRPDASTSLRQDQELHCLRDSKYLYKHEIGLVQQLTAEEVV